MWLPKIRFDYLVVNLTPFTNHSVFFFFFFALFQLTRVGWPWMKVKVKTQDGTRHRAFAQLSGVVGLDNMRLQCALCQHQMKFNGVRVTWTLSQSRLDNGHSSSKYCTFTNGSCTLRDRRVATMVHWKKMVSQEACWPSWLLNWHHCKYFNIPLYYGSLTDPFGQHPFTKIKMIVHILIHYYPFHTC